MKTNRLFRKVFLPVVIVLLTLNFSSTKQDLKTTKNNFDCFSVLVGKDASFDGSVLFAHNEDDGGKQVVNWYMVASEDHKKGKKIELKNGGILDQAINTNRFIWLEMPGMDFGDSYMNEWGVTIGTNSCPSKEKDPDISNGGIGYRLRGIMAERSKSAKEAVKIAGELIEKFGYTGSGRSYCVADTKEAWIINVVKGKHWVAQKVPDDKLVIIPNYYTITEVDLSDKDNFMGSSDLIDYAIKKEWYDEESDGDFNFRLSYGSQGAIKSMGNIGRKWSALNILSEKKYDLNENFPFAITPSDKIDLNILINVLSDHYEGTELDKTNNYINGDPHHAGRATICARTTRYGFIAQLRDWLPVEMGAVMWIAPQRPCTQTFIPWYSGIESIPEGYGKADPVYAMNNHYHPPGDVHEPAEIPAFWSFIAFSEKADENYIELIPEIRKNKELFQRELLSNQGEFEKEALSLYKNNKQKFMKKLTAYTNEMAKRSWKMTK